jgi:hypothetical protein
MMRFCNTASNQASNSLLLAFAKHGLQNSTSYLASERTAKRKCHLIVVPLPSNRTKVKTPPAYFRCQGTAPRTDPKEKASAA